MNFFDDYWLNPKDTKTFYVRAKQLAQGMVPDTQSRDPYWDRMGQVFVETVILSEKELDPKRLNAGRIAQIFQMGLPAYCEDAMKRIKNPTVRHMLKTVVDSKDVKSVAEVIQNVRSHLSVFLLPPIDDAFSVAEIWPGDCRRRRQTIIYVSPLEGMGAMNVPTRFFLEGVLMQLQSPQFAGDVPVQVQVDELAQFGRVDTVAKSMSSLRRANSFLICGINDFGTLQHIYGKELADTFINNAGLTVFCSAKDAAGTEFLSRKLGETEVFTEGLSVSVPTGKGSVSFNRNHGKIRRRVMEPFEIAQMNPENLIAFMDGVTRPILIAKRPYYTTDLKKVARPNPYAPKNS